MRTFLIGFSNLNGIPLGTAFALDIKNKRYLVTASHVIESMDRKEGTIYIFRNKRWNPYEVIIVGKGDANNPETDIAVLSSKCPLPVVLSSPDFSLNPSVVNILWGQRVYFCGFPYGQYIKDATESHPIPLTKGAILSGMQTTTSTEKGMFILDGHNNEGFSGGPAVFQLGEDRNADFQVFGVVRGYRANEVDISHKGKPTELTSMENTGLMHCPSIMRAVEMIESNPIGFDILGQGNICQRTV